MIKLILRLFRGKTIFVLGTLLSSLIIALDGIVGPHYMGLFTNSITEKHYGQVPQILLFWGALLLLINIAEVPYAYFYGRLREKINIELKQKVFQHAYKDGNDNVRNSEYVATILNDIKKIETDFVYSAVHFIYCLFQGGITLVFLLSINWQVGLVFIGLGFLPTIVPRLTAKGLKTGSEKWQQTNQSYTDNLEDDLNARKLVKHYNAIPIIFNRHQRVLKSEEDAYFTMDLRQEISGISVRTLYNISTILSLGYGFIAVMNGGMTLGALLTVYMAADRVVTPLISLVTYYNRMQATEPLFTRVFDNSTREPVSTSPIIVPEQRDLIDAANVTIGYDQHPLLSNLTFSIAPRDRILIQGESGSGKSTLIRALMNELDIQAGTISYSQIFSSNFKTNFAVVEQAPFIFADTLRFNLTLGDKNPDADLITILQRVGLNKFADSASLDILLDSSQYQLSGGEIKRLAVARALLYHKQILVVDEALSGLDSHNADLLNRIILDYPGTVIDIEHRVDQEIKQRFTKCLAVGEAT
ncbi:ATP-binding cassette domain-containing protein [Lapidilactobacillus bayanensis]|uniref:ATP-binding cassette domain-containing protein n=1 Tax=Lapidilactobacillus bayanensis TaxID=2485998 RepID=UPI000F78552A|nr:ABC transporter ATP-binding protein [Lapidilactobacillus bayanensis]